jgi:hypothetical protein
VKRILALLAGCTFLVTVVANEMATPDEAKLLSQQDQTTTNAQIRGEATMQ